MRSGLEFGDALVSSVVVLSRDRSSGIVVAVVGIVVVVVVGVGVGIVVVVVSAALFHPRWVAQPELPENWGGRACLEMTKFPELLGRRTGHDAQSHVNVPEHYHHLLLYCIYLPR